ncbi:hypothetical protein JCM19232_2614 [Vibrio ishigakensis]|uniref:Uncharacterized protein n=1 Tax=Vibrio ishigakensis TaxID=1481914 RepID=A0A0B8PLQ2_9VIBR|nr:hypothetical protein JCM19232_2614 [Vibrio ishigakensis]
MFSSIQIQDAMKKAVAFSIQKFEETGYQVSVDYSPHCGNKIWLTLHDFEGEPVRGEVINCIPPEIDSALARLNANIHEQIKAC